MTEISFTVSGIPKPQPRPKAVIRGKHAGVYDPGTANAWRQAVYDEAVKHAPHFTPATPIEICLDFQMVRPKSHFGTGKNYNKLKERAPHWHISKTADIDNLVKAVLDELVQAKVILDDCFVCLLHAGKKYGYEPGCKIRINYANETGEQP